MPKKSRPKTAALMRQIEDLQNQVNQLNADAREYQACGWSLREKSKLRALEYMYHTLINLQCHCRADRKQIDDLLEEVRHVMVPKEGSWLNHTQSTK